MYTCSQETRSRIRHLEPLSHVLTYIITYSRNLMSRHIFIKNIWYVSISRSHLLDCWLAITVTADGLQDLQNVETSAGAGIVSWMTLTTRKDVCGKSVSSFCLDMEYLISSYRTSESPGLTSWRYSRTTKSMHPQGGYRSWLTFDRRLMLVVKASAPRQAIPPSGVRQIAQQQSFVLSIRDLASLSLPASSFR